MGNPPFWGLLAAAAPLIWAGLLLRRWADVYAAFLHAGAAPDARTLARALGAARAGRFCPWRDGAAALALGACAWALLFSPAGPAMGAAGLPSLFLCLVLCALAWLDARSGLLPDALTLPLMALGWVLGPLAPHAAVGASLLLWAGLAAAARLYRGVRGRDGFGGGDVKYLAALAAWLGAAPALWVLWLACLLGILAWACIPRLRVAASPFGPCLTAAALPVILWPAAVQSWF